MNIIRLPVLVVTVVGLTAYTLSRSKVRAKLSHAKQKITTKVASAFVETPPIEITNN